MISHPLSWIIAVPLLALISLFFVPASNVSAIRKISTIGTLVSFVLSLIVFFAYNRTVGGFQFIENIPWVVPFGISYHLGVDGINSLLVVLLGFGSFTAVLATSSIKERVKEYYILLLLIIVGTYAAFLSLDIFFFYFAHEVAAIPTFLLIAVWDSDRKEYAAMKLTLYAS